MGVFGAAQGGRGQQEPRGPAARVLREGRDEPCPEVVGRGTQHRARLVDGEAQMLGADHAQLVGRPQPGEGQRRVGASRQDDPQPGRPVPHQRRHSVDRRRGDELMDVVEHEDDVRGQGVETVGDLGEEVRVRARVGGHGERVQAAGDGHRGQPGHGVEHRRPEPAVVVVVGRDRHPGRVVGAVVRRVRQQRRLAVARRCGDQHDLPVLSAVEPFAQPGAAHVTVRQPGDGGAGARHPLPDGQTPHRLHRHESTVDISTI